MKSKAKRIESEMIECAKAFILRKVRFDLKIYLYTILWYRFCDPTARPTDKNDYTLFSAQMYCTYIIWLWIASAHKSAKRDTFTAIYMKTF